MKRDWATALLALVALAATLAYVHPEFRALVSRFQALAAEHALVVFFASAGLFAFGLLAWTGRVWYPWHLLANQFPGRPRLLRAPWVIDGDTIEDMRSGKRYRLANIDAPETGDHARCFNERRRGEEAKRVAILLIRSASAVTVRETFRIDKYGRRVAFVLIDGDDLGENLLRRGLARPWRGRRYRWCGPKGGLAAIANTGLTPHQCFTCGVRPRVER